MSKRYEITGRTVSGAYKTIGYWFTDEPMESVAKALVNAIDQGSLNYWDSQQKTFSIMTQYKDYTEISVKEY